MSRADTAPTTLDDAARAGSLSYVGGLTQDRIAAELGVSRQREQRLFSRALADELQPQRCDSHRIDSLIGNSAPGGSATFFDVIMRIADKLHAEHYPMPVPVISDTVEECAALRRVRAVQAMVRQAESAKATFVARLAAADECRLGAMR